MKKKLIFVFIILLSIALESCGNEKANIPKNLIPQNTMEEILYDLAIIDGARIADPQGLIEAGISQQAFIFEKYKIDSLQFAESNNYYTSNIDGYIVMLEKVLSKIEIEKTVLDSIVKAETKINDSLNKIAKDSIQQKSIRTHQVFSKKSLQVKTEEVLK